MNKAMDFVLTGVANAVSSVPLPIDIVIISLLVIAIIVLVILLIMHRTKKVVSFEHSSEIDEGTGLGNRYYLSRMYHEKVKPEKRDHYVIVCIYYDSERIERIYGRDAMLDFVRNAAGVTKKYLTKQDFMSRIPGVGIVCLVHTNNKNLEHEIGDVVQHILQYNDDHMFIATCRAAAGVYRLNNDDDDIHECVFKAWQTAEQAYDANELYRFCSVEMLEVFMEERKMREEISRAFENHEFITYIQFYVDTQSTHIVGGEALTRWHHPEKGFVSPARFIPFMEREDIIQKMDYYNLEEVCKFLDEMYHKGIDDIYISCNFSRKTFSAPNFVDTCLNIFSKHDFPKKMIAFEMTESMNVRNIEQANKNAVQIKALGIKILLDDFGEGFASFFDLTEYPIDGVKIDKALVDTITTLKGNTIVRGMTRMSHAMNMTVIVEGVESDEQVRELQDIKCDVIQGFRFHRPIPIWEAKEKLLGIQETNAS